VGRDRLPPIDPRIAQAVTGQNAQCCVPSELH
jgi:hypothetical protein